MSEHLTEEQQVEQLKKWWKENGRSIILGVVLGIAAIGGWQGWLGYKDSRAEEGAMLYDRFSANLKAGQVDAAKQSLESLKAEYDKTLYVDFANMRMASQAANSGNSNEASALLQQVMTDSKDKGLVQIAAIRLAKLQTGEGKTAEARETLKRVTDAAFEADALAVEGQIALKEGNREAARIALEAAQEKGAADAELIRYLLQQLTPSNT